MKHHGSSFFGIAEELGSIYRQELCDLAVRFQTFGEYLKVEEEAAECGN
jgi:hypothetical protein